jgi:hypothetical protein
MLNREDGSDQEGWCPQVSSHPTHFRKEIKLQTPRPSAEESQQTT